MSKEGERKCGAYRLLDPAKGKRDPNWRQVSKVEELKERWQRVKGRRDRDRRRHVINTESVSSPPPPFPFPFLFFGGGV